MEPERSEKPSNLGDLPGFINNGFICDVPSDESCYMMQELIPISTGTMASCDSPPDEANVIKNQPTVYPKGFRTKTPKKKCRPLLKSLAKSLPVIIGAILLSVMVVDQGTDVVSTYQVCTADCRCIWYEEKRDFKEIGVCGVPAETYEENDACLASFGSYELLTDYCNYAMNQSQCSEIMSWHSDGLRHPNFCIASFISILVPSIMNSTLLLISLWNLYPSVLRYVGLSQGSYFFRSFKITLLVMYVLQMLPYTWLVMNFLIVLKVWKIEGIKGLAEKETWDITTNRWRLIFSILEDATHLLIHSMYIINSVIGYSMAAVYAGKFSHGFWSYLGFISSAVSIALTMSLLQRQSTRKTAFMKFFTTLVSVGIRACVCAAYASLVIKGFSPLFWPFALPPVTAIALFIVEYGSLFIYKFAVNFKHSHIRDNVSALRNTGIMNHIKDFTYSIISLTFGVDSVKCLISSYTYLAFAVLLDTAWVSAVVQSFFAFSLTETIFLGLQYSTFVLLLINLAIVQWEGKQKGRCLIYSIIFLMFIAGIYIWVQIDLKSFGSLYIPEKRYDYVLSPETIQITLSSLTPMFSMAGIICFVNTLIMIISLLTDPSLGMNQNIELLKHKLKSLSLQ